MNIVPPQGASTTLADFGPFWEAWQDINDHYLRNPDVSSTAKVYGAINGLVQSLGDPYTEFFSPADNQQFQQDISGNFGGIGAELGTDAKNEIAIVAPLKGTPAEAAGLKAQDIVVGINGSSTDAMTVDQAVNIIRGPIGTKVTLTIMRSGWTKPEDFTITRENIQVPIVACGARRRGSPRFSAPPKASASRITRRRERLHLMIAHLNCVRGEESGSKGSSHVI